MVLLRGILSILMLACLVVVVGYIIYIIVQLAAYDSEADGYWINVVFSVLVIVSLSILVLIGTWGVLTGDSQKVRGLGSNFACIVILMIIQGIVYAYFYSTCPSGGNEVSNRFVDCSTDGWSSGIYYQVIIVAIFGLIAAVVAFALASVLKKDKGYDY